MSRILKPLSAITEYPSSSRSNNWLSCVIFLSLVFPVQNLDRKLKYPEGVIPTKALIVLCPLYSLQVALWAYGGVGFSMNTSVQSIIIRVFGYFLKEWGRFFLTASLLGQSTRVSLNRVERKPTQVVKIRLTWLRLFLESDKICFPLVVKSFIHDGSWLKMIWYASEALWTSLVLNSIPFHSLHRSRSLNFIVDRFQTNNALIYSQGLLYNCSLI